MHHSIHTREVEWNDDNDGEPEQEEVAGLPRLGSVWIGRGAKCGESSVAQDMKVLSSSSLVPRPSYLPPDFHRF